MARVTVEDCIEKVDSRFELIVLSAQRSRQLSSGAPLLVERDKDKNPVVALREIADTDISLENLKENIVRNLQNRTLVESQDDDEVIDILQGQQSNDVESYEERIFESIEDGMPSQDGLSNEFQFEDVDTNELDK